MADWQSKLRKLDGRLSLENPDEFFVLVNELLVFSLELPVRRSFQYEHIQLLKELSTRNITELLHSSLPSSSIGKEVIPMLKLLRNLCAEMPDNQRIIGKEEFMNVVIDLIKTLCRSETKFERTSEELLLLKVCVQLLGNCCVHNENTQCIIWQRCYPRLFRLFLSDIDSDVVNCSCMLIHACIQNDPERRKVLVQCFSDDKGEPLDSYSFCGFLLSLQSAQTCEWIAVIIRQLLQDYSLRFLFNELPKVCLRVSLLSIILNYEKHEDKSFYFLNSKFLKDNIDFLVLTFTNLVSALPRLSDKQIDKDGSLDVSMLVSVLEILCQSSSQTDVLKVLQTRQLLMTSLLDLLTALSENDGSSSSTRKKTNSRTSLHGVKRNLVQLLGNMCFKCKKNQDFMNDHIPLLLNQCKIDHSNPYITQWTIWTIRNICEDHPMNQRTISQFEKQGGSSIEELQKNFGCEVEIDKFGKLKIKKT